MTSLKSEMEEVLCILLLGSNCAKKEEEAERFCRWLAVNDWSVWASIAPFFRRDFWIEIP